MKLFYLKDREIFVLTGGYLSYVKVVPRLYILAWILTQKNLSMDNFPLSLLPEHLVVKLDL